MPINKLEPMKVEVVPMQRGDDDGVRLVRELHNHFGDGKHAEYVVPRTKFGFMLVVNGESAMYAVSTM